jgi:hypothetical protein
MRHRRARSAGRRHRLGRIPRTRHRWARTCRAPSTGIRPTNILRGGRGLAARLAPILIVPGAARTGRCGWLHPTDPVDKAPSACLARRTSRITGPHSQEKIPRLRPISENSRGGNLIANHLTTVVNHPVNNEVRANQRVRIFPGSVDIAHNHVIGEFEGLRELLGEDPRPREQMWLEDHPQLPIAHHSPGGPQQGRNLCRMMRIVVNDPHPTDRSATFEPSSSSAKVGDPGDSNLRRYPEE